MIPITVTSVSSFSVFKTKEGEFQKVGIVLTNGVSSYIFVLSWLHILHATRQLSFVWVYIFTGRQATFKYIFMEEMWTNN